MEIFKLDKIYKTIVINRPPKKIKSPYLVDIIDPIDKSIVLCHSPALGLGGLIKSDTIIKVTSKDTNAKSKYSLDFVVTKDKNKMVTIGANPMYANCIVKSMLLNNRITELQDVTDVKGEISINDSRLDFFCKKKDKNVYIEVKNVPLAENYDSSHVNKKIIHNSNKKIAIFPMGYRKSSLESISERALKHTKALMKLAKNKNNETYMIYVTQREDVDALTISILDYKYYNAVIKAKEAGVRLLAYKIVWKQNKAFLGGEIPILL